MTVKINTKDGQIELTDEVIATVVGGAATETVSYTHLDVYKRQ